MGADDGVHTVIKQQVLDVFLGGAVGIVILTAPVNHGDDDIGILVGCIAQHALDLGGIDLLIVAGIVLIEEIDAVFTALGQGHSVHALGKCHKGHPDAVNFLDHIAAGISVFLIGGVCAQALKSCVSDGLEGSLQAVHSVIDNFGVGHLQHIHTGVLQGGKHLGRCRAQLRTVGAAAQNALKIQQGIVCIGQQRYHIQEHLRKIKGDSAGCHQFIGHIQVAGSGNMDHRVGIPGGFLLGGLHHRLRDIRAGLDGFCLGWLCLVRAVFILAPGHEEDQDRAADQNRHRSQNALHQFLLLLEALLPFFIFLGTPFSHTVGIKIHNQRLLS